MAEYIKEDDSMMLRRTTYQVIGNPPPMLPSSSITHRKLSVESGIAKISSSKSHNLKYELQSPSILKNEKYNKLYEDILKDMKAVHRHISVEQNSKVRQKIKESIAKVIRLNSDQGDFNERFGIKSKVRKARSVYNKKRSPAIGFTSLQKQKQQRNSFFIDHRKVIGFEQECMLLQYYLKDEENQKAQINYLKGLEQTSRHRRITPTAEANYKLYKAHDEREYKSLKKRVHLKEQFVEKCLEFVKKNSSYRRRENFREIEYVMKQHNKSLMEETLILESDEEEMQKLRRNNMMTRLYLYYGFMSIQSRIDGSKTELSLKRLKEDLWKIDGSFSFRELDLDRRIKTIFKYKNQQVIRFQDFKELLLFFGNLVDKDILDLFQKKFPGNIFRAEDIYLQENWNEIDRYLSHHKVKFLLQIMFKTFPEKIVGQKVLPIKVIPSIFRTFGISEKDFKLEELLTNYHWVQHHDAGLTFDEFYKGSILLKMKGEDWKGIEVFLKKINIKGYLKS